MQRGKEETTAMTAALAQSISSAENSQWAAEAAAAQQGTAAALTKHTINSNSTKDSQELFPVTPNCP